MRLHAVCACAVLCLAALAAPSPAGDDTYGIRFLGRKGSLGVLGEGRPLLLHAPGRAYDWMATPKVGRTEIRVLSVEKYRGDYLAYDPKAEGEGRGKVFLSEKAGAGAEWLTEKVKGEPSVYAVRAASGKVKGWYLDVAEDAEKAEDGDKQGKAYRVFLSEKPRKTPKWEFILIGS